MSNLLNLGHHLDKILFKVYYLSDGSISSVESNLGISSNGSAGSVGHSAIQTISTVGKYLALILAVAALVMIGLKFIVLKRDEERAANMGRLVNVLIGVFLVFFAISIVAWLGTSIV